MGIHVMTCRDCPEWLSDQRLSYRARGLMAFLLGALPNPWDGTLESLAAASRDSAATVKAAVTELHDAGYLRITYGRDPLSGEGLPSATWMLREKACPGLSRTPIREPRSGSWARPEIPSEDNQVFISIEDSWARPDDFDDRNILFKETKETEREIEKKEKESFIKEKEIKDREKEREKKENKLGATKNLHICAADFPGIPELLQQFSESIPQNVLDNNAYWVKLSYVTDVDDLEFLTKEFAKISAWLDENPRRAPKVPSSWQRFVRVWLTRAYEYRRRQAT